MEAEMFASTLPQPETGKSNSTIQDQIRRNEVARQLLAEWMADDSGYDDWVWPIIERLLKENPVSIAEEAR